MLVSSPRQRRLENKSLMKLSAGGHVSASEKMFSQNYTSLILHSVLNLVLGNVPRTCFLFLACE